jgi:hypothetical protein
MFRDHHHTLLQCNQGEKLQTACALMHTDPKRLNHGFEPAAESG